VVRTQTVIINNNLKNKKKIDQCIPYSLIGARTINTSIPPMYRAKYVKYLSESQGIKSMG